MPRNNADPVVGEKAYEDSFSVPGLILGAYRCLHQNIGRGPEQLARSYSINVPTRGVYMKHGRFGGSLVDVQRAVFYSRDETYRTSHPCGCGDAGYYLLVSPEQLRGLVADLDPELGSGDRDGFAFADGPLPASATLETHRLARDADSAVGDRFALEERTLELARSILDSAYRVRRRRTSFREVKPTKSRRDLVERAAILLSSRLDPTASLSDLANAVDASPFHLSRTFHEVRGITLREYRDRIRLDAALDRILAGQSDLTRLALDLGYASHSHLTYRFRRRFGVVPSRVREEFASFRARP